VTTAEKLTQ